LLFGFSIMCFANTSYAADSVRIDGKDRFEVAVNISNKGWSSGANTVILSNYLAAADALAASPLASKYNAPILLVKNNDLTDTTLIEIKRLKPNKVIIVGGEGSVSAQVVDQLRKAGISTVDRIGGKNRYEVAYNISIEFASAETAILANGNAYADALAIAPYAAKNSIPILLTGSNQLPSITKDALRKNTIVVGGEGSVDQSVYNQLPGPQRIGGRDRYEVASNVLRQLTPNVQSVYISNGLSFADALTGSVLAAKENNAMLLTMVNKVPETTAKIINEKKLSSFTFLGGIGSISNQVVTALGGPLAGATIVLDPGHGGTDPGASGFGLKEKDVVLDVGLRAQKRLEAGGAKVIMTRSKDIFIPLDGRVDIGNNSGADAFISIHANAFNGSANGTETYWYGTYESEKSKQLASEIQKELLKKLGTNNRGVKDAGFYVIKYTKIPSVLLELGFIDNKSDAQKLASNYYRDQAADAIYQGVLNYYK